MPDYNVKYYDGFILLKAKEGIDLSRYGRYLYNLKLPNIEEVLSSSKEVLIKTTKDFDISQLPEINKDGKPFKHRIFEMPIYFEDGEDWSVIERQSKLKREAIIDRLLFSTYTLDRYGFAPGFLYLNGLDPQLYCPRKDQPSTRIKSKTFAVGGNFLGFYSLPTPAGWYALGRSPVDVLQWKEDQPISLNIGDQIQLIEIGRKEYESLILQNLTIKEYNGIT